MTFTKAQLGFVAMHLRRDLAKNGFLTKYAAGGKTYVFVLKCRDLGLIEIVDPDDRFPYNWAGTRVTSFGLAQLERPS